MKPKIGIKLWHNRQWQLYPGSEYFLEFFERMFWKLYLKWKKIKEKKRRKRFSFLLFLLFFSFISFFISNVVFKTFFRKFPKNTLIQGMAAFSRPRFDFVWVRDAESLINRETVAKTCGPLKRMVSEPYVTITQRLFSSSLKGALLLLHSALM